MTVTTQFVYCPACQHCNAADSVFCSQCGARLEGEAQQKVATEQKREPEDLPPPPPPPFHAEIAKRKLETPLWNPVPVIAWSLLFTPVFGAILLAMNWEAMGDSERAKRNFNWATVVGVFIFGLSNNADVAESLWVLELIALVAWVYFEARHQLALLRADEVVYPKRGWLLPLVIAMVASFLLRAWTGHVAARS